MKPSTFSRLLVFARSGFSLLSCLGASGCTRFASELDTPTEQPGTQTLGLDRDWSCVAEQAGNPVMNLGDPLDVRIAPRDYITGLTPANLRMRACFRPDVYCMRPVTEWLEPDAEGAVTVPLNEGFNGYLEITADEEVPTLYMFPAPLTADLVVALQAVTVSLLPPAALLAFGETEGLVLEPAAGVISINAFDCSGPAAPGVRLELNTSAVPFAFIDGLPVAFEDTTTRDGAAGFANVLPGLVVVKGFRGDTMELVGLETLLVRSSWVTLSNLMPQFAESP